jgi:hypothetical protein
MERRRREPGAAPELLHEIREGRRRLLQEANSSRIPREPRRPILELRPDPLRLVRQREEERHRVLSERLREGGEEFAAEPGAESVARAVGTVLRRRAKALAEGAQRRPAEPQRGADAKKLADPGTLPHAGEPAESGAAQEVQEHGLGPVVGRMRGGDRGAAVLPGEPGEDAVALPPRGGLARPGGRDARAAEFEAEALRGGGDREPLLP